MGRSDNWATQAGSHDKLILFYFIFGGKKKSARLWATKAHMSLFIQEEFTKNMKVFV